jgi:hypothetical protein
VFGGATRDSISTGSNDVDRSMSARLAEMPHRRGSSRPKKEYEMWWFAGIGAVILYFVLLFVLGLSTLRNGHGWLFFFGIFFPVLWLVGALMRPSTTHGA